MFWPVFHLPSGTIFGGLRNVFIHSPELRRPLGSSAKMLADFQGIGGLTSNDGALFLFLQSWNTTRSYSGGGRSERTASLLGAGWIVLECTRASWALWDKRAPRYFPPLVSTPTLLKKTIHDNQEPLCHLHQNFQGQRKWQEVLNQPMIQHLYWIDHENSGF